MFVLTHEHDDFKRRAKIIIVGALLFNGNI